MNGTIGNNGTETTLSSTFPTEPEANSDDFYCHQFLAWYTNVHGYVATSVCVFGIISNALIILVLTRKSMVSPTNCILIALAVADLLLMLTYLVFAIYAYIVSCNHSQGWMYFIICGNLFAVALHNIILWLTVTLAVFQFISVRHPLAAATYCSVRRARISVIIAVIATVVLSTPHAFVNQVYAFENNTGYWIADSEFAIQENNFKQIMQLSYGVFIKVVPSFLLAVLSGVIIYSVRRANERCQKILGPKSAHALHETKQMTYMLLSVIVLFVIIQLPQGIVVVLGAMNDEIWKCVYTYLVDIFDLLSLINSALIFVIYCRMSKKFRTEFRKLLSEMIKLGKKS